WRMLLERPFLLHRLDVISRKLADIAAGVRHFMKTTVTGRPARAFLEFNLSTVHFETALAERNDELSSRLVIAHRLPIMAALGAGTNADPFSGLGLCDVRTVCRLAALRVDLLPYILVNGFLVPQELAVASIHLPQKAGFADGVKEITARVVDDHPLENFIK